MFDRHQLLLWETTFTNRTLASASQRTSEEPMSMTHSVTSLDGGRSRNQRKCRALFLTQTWWQRSVSNRETALSLVQTRSSIQLLNCTCSNCYRQKNSGTQHLQCYSPQQEHTYTQPLQSSDQKLYSFYGGTPSGGVQLCPVVAHQCKRCFCVQECPSASVCGKEFNYNSTHNPVI